MDPGTIVPFYITTLIIVRPWTCNKSKNQAIKSDFLDIYQDLKNQGFAYSLQGEV